MEGAAYAAALMLATVFAGAGAAKLARREVTARAFAALGLGSSPALAVGVPVLELVLAAGLVAVPEWAAVVALAVLAGFSAFVVSAVARGRVQGCGCFGSAHPAPMGDAEVLRNVLLAAAAGLAATSDGPVLPSPGALAVVGGASALGAAAVRAATRRPSRLGRRQGPRPGSVAPPLPAGTGGGGGPQLVAFLAPGCRGCDGLRSALAGYRGRSGLALHAVELDDDSAATFAAFDVVAPPFVVVVGGDGIVRRTGAAGDRSALDRLVGDIAG